MTDPEDFIDAFQHLIPVVGTGAEVLDVACGTGRHAVFFAQRGCRVDALDRSGESLELLGNRARSEHLPVRTFLADVEAMSLLPESIDIIVNTLFLYRPLFPQYLAALRPGGVLYFRTFTTDHADLLGRAHPGRAFQLAPFELREAFESLQIIHYQESVERDRAVASLVGVRR